MNKKIIIGLSVILLILGVVNIDKLRQEELLTQETESLLSIHEVVTSNGSYPDEEGDYPDWIELYYGGSETLELSGYYLSDDPKEPLRWRFPELVMEPDSYLVIYASGKNQVTASGEIHTNFKLNCMGETLSISDSQGKKLLELKVPEIPFDYSYGIDEEAYAIFETASPGEGNTQQKAAAVKETSAVVYSMPAGSYEEAVSLELTTRESGAVIYYTLDGSIPTKDSLCYKGEPLQLTERTEEENRYTSVWSSPFDWDGQEGFSYNPNPQYKATVVKTRLYFSEEDIWSKDVWTNTYLIGSDYQLPIVSLSVEEADLFDRETGLCVPGKDYQYYLATAEEINPEPRLRTGNYSDNRKVSGYLEYFDENGEQVLQQPVTLRMAGNLSRGNGMKSFIVNAWGDGQTGYFQYPFFGNTCTDLRGNLITQFSSLRLRNFGNDWRRSKFRDALSQSLIDDPSLGTQAYQPAILLLNGEYYGLVEIRENRDETFFENHFGIPDGGYEKVEVKGLTRETAAESGQEFLDLIDYMQQNDLSEKIHYEYVDSRLDISQLLDYILVQLYLQNLDWYENNCLFYRSVQSKDGVKTTGKWQVLLYDMDYAINYEEENNYEKFWKSEYECAKMFRALMKNEDCRAYTIQRFEELLEENFEPSRAIALQQQFEQQIAGYVQEDLSRWDVYQGETLVKSVSLEYWYLKMEDLRKFLTDRPAYAREYFYACMEEL